MWEIKTDKNDKYLNVRTHGEYIEWLRTIKNKILIEARKSQIDYDEKRKHKYDKRVTNYPTYKVGDLVRYYIYDAHKLSPKWSDVHKITKFLDDHIVRLVHESSKKERVVHIDHLKLSTHVHIPKLEPIPQPNEIELKNKSTNVDQTNLNNYPVIQITELTADDLKELNESDDDVEPIDCETESDFDIDGLPTIHVEPYAFNIDKIDNKYDNINVNNINNIE